MASPPMGGSRSCQRQTCTASRTDSGLAVLAFALRLVPRCRANLAPQAIFHNSSAAVSVPFRRLPTLARYGEPLLSPHWFDRASTFGLGTVKQCPAHVPYTLLSYPKPSAFHSHVSTCQPTIGASFQPTAQNRPRTPRANFTLAHKSVLVKFSFSRTQRRALNRAARASSLAVRFTSERRKWFLPCSGCSALVPRRRAASHRKGFVYFLFQALPRPLRS